jgi:hypothetical protein
MILMSFMDMLISFFFGTFEGLSLFLSVCVGGSIVLVILGAAVIENRSR